MTNQMTACKSIRFTMTLLLVAALLFVGTAWAQPARGRGAGGFGGALRSPEVSADGRVTFRLRAPNAKEVFVTGVGQRLAMEKDEQGVWTVTTEPLKPDMYAYSFSVDGATFNDPGNPLSKTSYGSAGQSMVHVPGDVIWEPGAGIARGAVTRHFYHSAIAGDDRDYWVYTPANYDPKRKEPYPVLYLLHGLGDDASSWIASGAANVILDNLIAQGKARPMLMVNTLGYGTSGGTRGAMAGEMIPSFARTVVEEVMPQVEKVYNVTKDRNQRAIAGLSMGGAEALYTGLNHLDRFAWIGSFSGAFVMWPRDTAARGAAPAAGAAPEAGAGGRGGRGGGQSLASADIERNFPKLDAKANAQIRLLWIGCGTADTLNGVNRQFKDWLKSKNIKFTDREFPDIAHVWPLWRQNLAEMAPMLFR
jgi:enterochelin esterase-like enzyme